jgi:hypothetical protein
MTTLPPRWVTLCVILGRRDQSDQLEKWARG